MKQTEAIPHLFRTEYRKIVSVLCKLFGIEHIEVAEDIVSDTFLLASELWALKGLPENPTELLANGKVKSLIDYLDHEFDVVIIDTSPSALVTDAFILSEFCDATLFVIRHNYTPKRLVNRIDESNQINTIHNPAIVFNGLKTRGVFKNNYGYGYDYVYGNKERGRKTKKAS